jgi:DNA-binding CsgD family transcriptional regulator
VDPSKLFEFSICGEPLAVVKLESDASPPAAELARFTVQGTQYAVIPTAPRVPAQPSPAHLLLTERELQIAVLVADGLINKEIADRLHISEWTVSTHVRRIYTKLGVSTRGAMVSRTASLRVAK